MNFIYGMKSGISQVTHSKPFLSDFGPKLMFMLFLIKLTSSGPVVWEMGVLICTIQIKFIEQWAS